KHSVSARGVNLQCAFANQRVSGFHERAGRVDDVVDNQRGAAANVADQVHHFADIDVDAAFIDDGQWSVHLLGEETRALHAARIGRNHGDVVQLTAAKE